MCANRPAKRYLLRGRLTHTLYILPRKDCSTIRHLKLRNQISEFTNKSGKGTGSLFDWTGDVMHDAWWRARTMPVGVHDPSGAIDIRSR